ncbi:MULTISPECIES: very short patch repair endonuclease [unclassified Exiguobacterium]|uniref:very short patch repair endonuclease n=1 Tax=unclassified Exiguobacterium TaxID=2644629 RepID=UPI001BE9E78F|nr:MULTISPECIES: very short patch repair endonuclease [unclassified Exiguobacterium]
MKNKNLSKVHGKDTKMEIRVRKELWKRGLRYRKNYRKLLGTPDIAFPNLKLVIFLDSCFWHGCPKHYKEPKSNIEFWRNKIKRNRERDKEQTEHYLCEDWTILRFWEHEVNTEFNRVITEIIKKHEELARHPNKEIDSDINDPLEEEIDFGNPCD